MLLLAFSTSRARRLREIKRINMVMGTVGVSRKRRAVGGEQEEEEEEGKGALPSQFLIK